VIAVGNSAGVLGTPVAHDRACEMQVRSFASVERFLAEVINQRAARGQTPLMLACANG
jgi:ankyrin repeat protein